MNTIIEFIGDNYSWFLTITLILLFAIIGYVFDTRREKNDLLKKTENEIDEESLENIVITEEKSLAEAVTKTKNINPETKTVELVDETIKNEEAEVNEN